MIYMTGTNKDTGKPSRIVVLSVGHLKRLQKGEPIKTPDGEVIICWTPDEPWLAERIEATGGDTGKIAGLIVESLRRPPTTDDRERFPPRRVHFGKEGDGGEEAG